MANTAPNRCIIVWMPDALPISANCTELSTAVGTVGSAIEDAHPGHQQREHHTDRAAGG